MNGQKEETMRVVPRSLLFAFALLVLSHAAFGQVVISVSFGPPALPVYEQPVCPDDGYIWTPGYWAYDDDDGYYWVPGTWVEAPQPGYLWTPGYWGWGDEGLFIFHEGYWGEHVGFYGGIDYGYGYGGRGYEGGRWDNGHFFYNTSVNHVNETIIHNTYNTRIVENNTTRVSYNGGNGGVESRPTAQEETYSRENHVGRVAAQNEHIQQARSNPQLRATNNQGKPPIAATAKAGDFKSGVVPARQAGGTYKAPPAAAARKGNDKQLGTEARPNNGGHVSELQPHKSTPPNTGNAATDKKYQQQQDKLAAQQNQEHQKVQLQQEKEHQQAAKKNASDTQKQQMEQRHTQQTQQLEQKHNDQQQKMQQRQQPRPNESRPTENHPPAEKPH
jgi:WXXGXW repeat (2 copies)